MGRSIEDVYVAVLPDLSIFPGALQRQLRTTNVRGAAELLGRQTGAGMVGGLAASGQQVDRSVKQLVARADVRAPARDLGHMTATTYAGELGSSRTASQVARELSDSTKSAEGQVGAAAESVGREGGNRFAGGLKLAAGAAAAAVGVLVVGAGRAAGQLVKSSFDVAKETEQSFGAVESTFGKASDGILQLAKDAATTRGLASGEYAQLAAVFGAQLRNMGVAGDQLAPKTDELITLGSDLAAMYGGTVSDAVAAVSSLLRGETDPIERYGVGIKAADVQARLAADGLDKLEGAAAKTATTQATLALLTEQTTAAQGQFSREAATAGGVAERQRAQLANIRTTIGTALLPAYVAVGKTINDQVLPPVQALAERYGPQLSSWITDKAVPAFDSFAAGLLRGEGPISGYSGALNTAGLGVRAFFLSLADPDVTSDGPVGVMERIGAGVRGVFDAVRSGDTSALALAFDIPEDSPALRAVTSVRDGVKGLAAAVADFDGTKLKDAVAAFVGDAPAAGEGFSSVVADLRTLAPLAGEAAAQLPTLSDALSVTGAVTGFLADHVDTLAKYMPLLVGAFIVAKAAQLGANIAISAGTALRVAEVVSTRQQTAALKSATAATLAEAGAKRGALGATVASVAAQNASTAATNRGRLATIAQTVASKAGAVATGALALAKKGLDLAMNAGPIGLVLTAITALVGGLIYAYKNSETFRRIVDGAFTVVKNAGLFLWERGLKPAFRFIVEGIATLALKVVKLRDDFNVGFEAAKALTKAGARTVTDLFLGMVEKLVQGAADAFGWVPGIGPKLEEAAGKFSTFRENVNRALGGIEDKDVTIRTQLNDTAAALVKAGADPAAAAKRVRNIGVAKDGGSITGPGTGTSDSIPYLLSNGEHVITAKEVARAGGHAAVEAQRMKWRRAADGGRVENGRQSAAKHGRAYNPKTDLLFEDGSWRPRTAGGTPEGARAAARAREVLAARERGVRVRASLPPTDNFDIIAGSYRVATEALAKNMGADVARLADAATEAGRAQERARAAAAASGDPGGPLPPASRSGWLRPGRGGRITSEFGMRFHPIRRVNRLHNGIDVAGLSGSRVLASQSGRVVYAGKQGSYGNFVQLQHAGGLGKTGYAHLASIAVKVGQQVAQGAFLGREGATGGVTGKHLHYNWLRNGWQNPRKQGVFDDGGVAYGRGYMPKNVIEPERVLSPSNSRTFDDALPVLERLVAGAGGAAGTAAPMYLTAYFPTPWDPEDVREVIVPVVREQLGASRRRGTALVSSASVAG